MPRNLAKNFEAAYRDPELLSSRGTASLLDARLIQLLEQIREHGPAELWKDLRKTWRKLKAAHSSGDATEMQSALAEVGRIIEAGASQGDVWQQIQQIVAQRTVLVTAEHKRQVELQLVMDIQQASAFTASLQAAVVAEITDRDMLIRISRRFAEILNAAMGRQVVEVPGSVVIATAPQGQNDNL